MTSQAVHRCGSTAWTTVVSEGDDARWFGEWVAGGARFIGGLGVVVAGGSPLGMAGRGRGVGIPSWRVA